MRKSTSKNRNSYYLLDLQFRTNKQKKSVHEEVLNPQSTRKKSQRLTKKFSRASRNSLPVKIGKQANSQQYSPRVRSPLDHPQTRRTYYYQQSKIVKKRHTEYETEERSARMKITNLSELCRKLLEIEAESNHPSPPKEQRHTPGKIVKNLPAGRTPQHRSTNSLDCLLSSECAENIKKSLAAFVPRGQTQLSPSSNSGPPPRKPPIRRLKDSEYYRFG